MCLICLAPQKFFQLRVGVFVCKKAIKLANSLIKNKGRLLVRSSGTEPKIRIMCESFNYSLINKCINIIKKTIH